MLRPASAACGPSASAAPSASSCGAALYNGVGVSRDAARAAALFKQACDGGVKTACDVLKKQNRNQNQK